MMTTWSLIERVEGATFVDTGERCTAESFGKAVELLLPAEVCTSTLDALTFDVLARNPLRTNLHANGAVYRVIPIGTTDVSAAVERDAAEILGRLRDGEGMV